MMIKCKCGNIVKTTDRRNNSHRLVAVCFKCNWGRPFQAKVTGSSLEQSPVEAAKERLLAKRGQELNTVNQFKRRG